VIGMGSYEAYNPCAGCSDSGSHKCATCKHRKRRSNYEPEKPPYTYPSQTSGG
jgi:hypothetical protein